jgi:hypothetical protein
MSNKERVLNYLRSISPRTATNAKISAATGVRPHQQVFQITSQLEKSGQINGRLFGKEWEYWITLEARIAEVSIGSAIQINSMSEAAGFENAARLKLQEHYGCLFSRGSVAGIPKSWDYLNPENQIVGDAKFYSMVVGERSPPAKMSVIAEYVWLLSKISYVERFLVFGNDKRVPVLWLGKYGHLADGISFWFLGTDGVLERLR